MKKKKEKNENKNNNKLDLFPNINDTLKNIIFIFFVIIIISLIIFLTQNDNQKDIPNTFTYNDIHFAKVDNNLWSFGLKYNDEIVEGMLIHYTPLHLEHIEVIGDLKSFLPSNETYLAHDPVMWGKDKGLKVALSDFGIKIAGLGSVIQGKPFFKDDEMLKCIDYTDETCEQLGVKTCNNEDKVIMFIEDDYTYITAEENCIKIYGNEEGLIKATNRIIYTWLNIMD